jgi:hypothetical protein
LQVRGIHLCLSFVYRYIILPNRIPPSGFPKKKPIINSDDNRSETQRSDPFTSAMCLILVSN